jgi:hypothetical protein
MTTRHGPERQFGGLQIGNPIHFQRPGSIGFLTSQHRFLFDVRLRASPSTVLNFAPEFTGRAFNQPHAEGKGFEPQIPNHATTLSGVAPIHI